MFSENSIPKTGCVPFIGTHSTRKVASADETEAILIEKRNDEILFQVLHALGGIAVRKEEKDAEEHYVRGDIVATWDDISQTGVSSLH